MRELADDPSETVRALVGVEELAGRARLASSLEPPSSGSSSARRERNAGQLGRESGMQRQPRDIRERHPAQRDALGVADERLEELGGPREHRRVAPVADVEHRGAEHADQLRAARPPPRRPRGSPRLRRGSSCLRAPPGTPQVPPWWLQIARCCSSTPASGCASSSPAAPYVPQNRPSGPSTQASVVPVRTPLRRVVAGPIHDCQPRLAGFGRLSRRLRDSRRCGVAWRACPPESCLRTCSAASPSRMRPSSSRRPSPPSRPSCTTSRGGPRGSRCSLDDEHNLVAELTDGPEPHDQRRAATPRPCPGARCAPRATTRSTTSPSTRRTTGSARPSRSTPRSTAATRSTATGCRSTAPCTTARSTTTRSGTATGWCSATATARCSAASPRRSRSSGTS